MKTLQEIKDEVAQEYDWKSYEDMCDSDFNAPKWVVDKVAKRYAEEALKEATERATMTVERNRKIITEKQIGWIAEDHDHLEPNKESILSLINELK